MFHQKQVRLAENYGALSKFYFKIQFVFADFHYSELTILHATKNHSGNYTCVPSNSQPASVVVHIFKGEFVGRKLYLPISCKHTFAFTRE